MRYLLLPSIVLVLGLAVACGGGSETSPDPTATPSAESPPGDETPTELNDPANAPPSLTVTSGETSIEAGLGSFCYGALCADAIGNVTPALALAGDVAGLSATLSAETIAEVSVTASVASSLDSQQVCTVVDGIEPGGPLCARDGEWLAWTGSTGEGVTLPATAAGASIEVDTSSLGSETYVVVFFVRFAGGGDASYGVLLEAIPAGAVQVGPFYVIEDDGLEFDEIATVCEADSVDDGSLLVGTPFESRRFPDFTKVFRCVDDGRVTAAVVRSSPSFRRYEFAGPPIVEWPGGESDYSQLDIDGMAALLAVQTAPGVVGHEAAIYVIEELPEGDAPGRMAELRFVSSGGAVCFMRQILDLDAPGPCES